MELVNIDKNPVDKEKILKRLEEWLQVDKFPDSSAELVELAKNENYDELRKRLMTRISFGTAGLRGRMAAGFSCMNRLIIVQTSQGLAEYLKHTVNVMSNLLNESASSLMNKTKNDSVLSSGIVIGHDHRHNSQTFADLTCRVFTAKGFKVWFFSEQVCTPLVPYAVVKLKACAGIMITASHNPREDNGYKLYGPNGAQIISPVDTEVSSYILKNLEIDDRVLDDTDYEARKKVLVKDPLMEISNTYLSEVYSRLHWLSDVDDDLSLKKKKNISVVSKSDSLLKVTYTPMHGVGHRWIKAIIEKFSSSWQNAIEFVFVKEQLEPDPDFPTVAYPNPEEGKGALKLAMQTADAQQSPLIFANDPDADRFALAEKIQDESTSASTSGSSWKIFNGNEIALLLADWIWIHRQQQQISTSVNVDDNTEEMKAEKKKYVMLASTVSSKVLKAMGQQEGFDFEETLTGFKWLGNKAWDLREHHNFTVLFSYEVEIGFAPLDISWDKDGVRTLALFAEMAQHIYLRQGSTLNKHLQELYRKYGYFKMKTRYFFCHDPQKMIDIFNGIRHFENQMTSSSSSTLASTNINDNNNDNNDNNNNGNKNIQQPKLQDEGYPKHVGKYQVASVRDMTTGYDSAETDGQSRLPQTPESQMITLRFVDGSTCTFRNSGTEPKLKWYVETSDAVDPLKAEEKLVDLTNTVISILLQPLKNNLIPPPKDDDNTNNNNNQ